MWPPGSPISSLGVCPAVIGRDTRLSDLRADVDRALGGETQVVLLSGDAGIGKSRLAAETKDYARTRGLRVLLDGQCFETDRASPYAPLLDLFQAYLAHAARVASPADISRSFGVTLSRLRPELALQFPDLVALAAPGLNEPEVEKRNLFAAVTHFVRQETQEGAVLLAVEDIHWCDELSLELLLHLVRRLRQAPLLVLVTYRGDDVPPWVRRWLAQLDRERVAHEYPLAGLTPRDVADMLRAMLGDGGIDRALVSMVADHAEGNPFFVEELVKTLLTSGALRCVDGRWTAAVQRPPVPRSVREAVHQRSARMSAEAQRLVTLAAVAGRRFHVGLLQAILGYDDAQLLARLKELVNAQLVVEEAADRFAFRHALTQEAIYTELLVRERQQLHRTIAETLLGLATPQAAHESHLDELAYHTLAGGMWERALKYGEAAGERALRLYAQQAAIEHFTRAVEAAHHLSSTVPVAPLSRLYLARGQAYETLGDFERARGDDERALDAARATRDQMGEWQAVLALGFLWTGHDYAQAEGWFRQALALADELGDPQMRARSLDRLGNWLLNRGRLQEAQEAAQEALRLYEACEDRRGMAEMLAMLGALHYYAGDPSRGVNEGLSPAIEIFRRLGDWQSLHAILAARALDSAPEFIESASSALRTREACLRDAEEALALARQTNAPGGAAFVEMAMAGMLCSFGDFGASRAHGLEALRIASAIEHQEWIAAANGVLGQLSLLLLEPATAITYLEAGVDGARTLGSVLWARQLAPYLALAHVRVGAFARAEAILGALLPRGERPGDFFERQVALIWGELALARGEASFALDVALRLIDSAPGVGREQRIPHLLALQGEALLALTRAPEAAEAAEAAEALELAKAGARERQAPAILWRVHRALGRAYHQLRREDDARGEWRAAREIIGQLAKSLDDPQTRERYLRAALTTLPRGQRGAGGDGASGAHGPLSAREREVAALVAQGKSNREIAASLVVSERTAEAHVSHILSKLGFITRAQIAAWVVERG